MFAYGSEPVKMFQPARADVLVPEAARTSGAASSGDPVHFQVTVRADPSALGRLIGYFSQLGHVPQRVRADRAGDLIAVSIVMDAIGDHPAGIIAEKMRSSPLVEHVVLHRGMHLLAPLSERRS